MSLCPKCRTPLSPLDLDGLPASTCKQCQGLWLAREFVELWAERRGRTSGVEARSLELSGNPATTTAWPCPDCATLMARIDANGMQIERCEQCQGVFFDRDELEAIGRRITGRAAASRSDATRPEDTKRTKPASTGVADSLIADLRRAEHANKSGSSDTFLGLIGGGILAVLEAFFDN